MSVITKYSNLYITILVNIFSVLGLIPIKVPTTPCRDKFIYILEKGIWCGDLHINPPNFNLGYAVLETHFSIGLEITDNNVGSIELFDDKTMVLEKMKTGIPLNYRVHFPYSNILPYLTSLVLNGEVICTGPGAPELPLTTYYLTHMVTVVNSNKNEIPRPIPNALPLQIPIKKPNNIPVVSTPQNSNTECKIIENQNSYPWLVGLFEPRRPENKFYCSGSLISTKHVITAAHCTAVQFKIFIKLGSNSVSSFTDPCSISRIQKHVYSHLEYDPEVNYADISIILLNEEIVVSPNIRPISLWPKEIGESSVIGKLTQLVGWTTNINEKPTEINFIVNPLEECDKFDNRFISEKIICASGELQTLGQCLGNSGGSLILSVNNRQMLRGIVTLTTIDSNPSLCTANNYYSLFTDITKFSDWIHFTLRLN